MSLPKKINPESFYDVKLNRLVVVDGLKYLPRSLFRFKGRFLIAFLETNKDAVDEAVEV